MANPQGGGGGGSFTVDADAIGTHGGTIGDVARDIQEKMGLMQRKLQTLQGQWKGSGANQFAILYGDWERQQRNVKDSLRNISLALGQSATDYRTTEQAVTRRFTTPS